MQRTRATNALSRYRAFELPRPWPQERTTTMLFIRFGLLFFMLVRVFVLIPQLRRRFTGNTASTVVDGAEMRFQFHVRRRSKTKNVTAVQLGLDLPDQFRFRIQRETAFDRFAKAIGIAHEWQTHDPRFDAEAYILSDDAVLLAALSGSESLREAVAGLLDNPSKS